jgi:hypothetical protein
MRVSVCVPYPERSERPIQTAIDTAVTQITAQGHHVVRVFAVAEFFVKVAHFMRVDVEVGHQPRNGSGPHVGDTRPAANGSRS